MYTNALYGALFACFFLANVGCDDLPALPSEQSAEPREHTLVFYDRSASTQKPGATQAAYDTALEQIVREHLDMPGDRLSVFFVHGHTMGKVNRLDLENKAKRPNGGGISERVFEAASEAFLREAITHLQAFCHETQVAAPIARHTDLLGTFEVISESFAHVPATDRLQVYFLSDMFESMNGPGRRDFDRRPPADKERAEQWAVKDAAWVQDNLVVDSSVLQQVNLRVLLGPHGNKPGAVTVKRYWASLLERVGFTGTHIVYN